MSSHGVEGVELQPPRRPRPSTIQSESGFNIDPRVLHALNSEIAVDSSSSEHDPQEAFQMQDRDPSPENQRALWAAPVEEESEEESEEELELATDEVQTIASTDGTNEDNSSLKQLIAELNALKEEPNAKYDCTGDDLCCTAPESLLDTDISKGLSHTFVIIRSKAYGPNQLPEERVNHLKKFAMYFVGPIQFVMEATIIMAIFARIWIDVGIICGLLILNAVVGFVQDFHAGNVVQELKKSLANKCEVIRGGEIMEVPSIQLVPGDIVLLEEGGIIPADLRLRAVRDSELQVDQSAITGESLPLSKHMGDVLYQSSIIRRGEGRAVVIATGSNTFVGHSAVLINEAGTTSGHFTDVIRRIGIALLGMVALPLFTIFVLGLLQNEGLGRILQSVIECHLAGKWLMTLSLALSITVVGVPVGLPAVVTTTMAVGASYLAKKKAIVQKLSAIESLAGVEILCSDKTGTLTKNKLTLGEPQTLGKFKVDELILTGCLAASRKLTSMDAIDKAFLGSLQAYPRALRGLQRCRTIQFTPFDSVSKKVIAVIETPKGEQVTCVKGAPAAVMQMIAAENRVDESLALAYVTIVENFASRGFRSLAVARRRQDRPWSILGIVPCHDPPRNDAADTVAEAQKLGLRIKMLTGDAIDIARETSRQLGLGTDIRKPDSLNFRDDLSAKSTSLDVIEEADGFAEVFPQHKNKVIGILQRRGYLVAMTGDGVNDAPSLKRADTGIAVEGASATARSAADIILLTPGLSAIIDAIKTSREIFHRMRAYIVYRIALTIHMVLFIMIDFLRTDFILPSSLTVFIAIFADLSTLAIAYDKAPCSPTPVKWNIPGLWLHALIFGLLLTCSTWLLDFILEGHVILATGYMQRQVAANSLLFLQIALCESWLIFICRSSGKTKKRPGWQLILAVLLVDAFAIAICHLGWFADTLLSLKPGTILVKITPYEIGIVCIYSAFTLILIAFLFWLIEITGLLEPETYRKAWRKIRPSRGRDHRPETPWP